MTEQSRPRIALVVTDVAESVAFYADIMGFTRADAGQDTDMACIIDSDGDAILLAGTGVEDVKSLLDEPRIVFKPGDSLDFIEHDLEARRQALAERGLTDVRVMELASGNRKLILKDPCGYILAFVAPAQRTPEETISLYVQGVEDLEVALAGLSEEQLDLTRGPQEWSIRQIVHHLAEGDSLFLMTMKTALAAPGSTFVRPPYDQTAWVEAMRYSERPIGPSFALIRAIRQHVAQLLHTVPHHWEQSITMKFADGDDQGRAISLGHLIDIQAGHIAEHCEEIRHTRRANGI